MIGPALAVALLAAERPSGDVHVWQLRGDHLEATRAAPQRPLYVGSLQKPFVARAWAETHTEPTPRVRCTGGAGCWLRPGHGALGLASATALSCNAYFRALASETEMGTTARVLGDYGFRVGGALLAGTAIGLPDRRGRSPVGITPEALLRAYRRLVLEPWPARDEVRRELLAGMREASLDGTARQLGERGVYAKTGTAPSLLGRGLETSGLAVTVDSAGEATLALVVKGTGAQAAAALAAPQGSRHRPAPRDGRVRVGLFGLLQPRRVVARNVSGAPLPARVGFVGPRGEAELRPGDRLEAGLWELSLPGRRLTRRIAGALEVIGRRDGTLEIVAELEPWEYVSGVARAELLRFDRERVVTLGAAVLRFLATGPRHATTDVCDSTHCAYFVGRGATTSEPRNSRSFFEPAAFEAAFAPEEIWRAIRNAALREGETQWTSHCGGEPLSARFVWGAGSEAVAPCRRHGSGAERRWERFWSGVDVAAAFGPGVSSLAVTSADGTWRLRAETRDGTRAWLYDEAHRRLARRLGWGALPSPADRVRAEGGGFRAVGRGLGHRVGLCLSD